MRLIQLIYEASLLSCNLGLHISWLCYSCSGIALPQAYFNCELSLTGWLRRIGESTSQFSWLSFLSLYGYNINEICGHYLMNHVRLISGGSVCKDGLLPPKFAPLFREKCGQSNQNCDYGEWRSNPIVHQKSFTLRTSRFLSTLFSLFALLLASFTSRSLRFK